MAAGGGDNVVAVVAAGRGAVAVDQTWLKPFKCHWAGCGKYIEKGASAKDVAAHMKGHSEARDMEQAKAAERIAARAQKTKAAAPSGKENRLKDMAAAQRKGGGNKACRTN